MTALLESLSVYLTVSFYDSIVLWFGTTGKEVRPCLFGSYGPVYIATYSYLLECMQLNSFVAHCEYLPRCMGTKSHCTYVIHIRIYLAKYTFMHSNYCVAVCLLLLIVNLYSHSYVGQLLDHL